MVSFGTRAANKRKSSMQRSKVYILSSQKKFFFGGTSLQYLFTNLKVYPKCSYKKKKIVVLAGHGGSSL